MPWTKGQSGNPSGRPRKGRSLAGLLRSAGGRRVSPEDPCTRLRALVETLWGMAIHDRNPVAIGLIFEYLLGRPCPGPPPSRATKLS